MRCFWKKTLLSAALAVAVPFGTASAQQYTAYPGSPGASNDELRARLDAQEAELRDLRQKMNSATPTSNASFESTSAEANANTAAEAEAANQGYVVGSDLSMKARWNPVNGVTFETPNKDFVSHFGFRFQLDFVDWQQPSDLKASSFGTLEDGVFFRRIRPSWDGTAYEVMEWNCELALEQIQNNVINLDEVWVGVKDLPFVNTVRIGHQKVPQGFEGDMTSSSKAMTFLERSAYTDAFYENFATGFWAGNHIADDHITLSGMIYKQDNSDDQISNNTGAVFNSGHWGYTGRITALPLYQDDGRHMLHLGVSGTWRDSNMPAVGQASNADYRARPQLRDQIGSEPLGDSNRLVDTGVINCRTQSVIGTELFYVLGPASLQAEWAWAQMNHATNGTQTSPALSAPSYNNTLTQQGVNLPFSGGYIQGSYFLTGENRIYDRRFGRLGSDYIATPYTPFWLVKDGNGDCCWGSGAWEVAFRYNHLDLDNQYLVQQGGEMDGYEFGVNWYLNTNLKLQFEFLHENVFGGGPHQDTYVNGFGMRTQFFF